MATGRWPDSMPEPQFPQKPKAVSGFRNLDESVARRARIAFYRSIVAVLLLSLGGILVSVGVGLKFDLPSAMIAFGLLIVAVGFAVGKSD